jgi:hypothetical protein
VRLRRLVVETLMTFQAYADLRFADPEVAEAFVTLSVSANRNNSGHLPVLAGDKFLEINCEGA